MNHVLTAEEVNALLGAVGSNYNPNTPHYPNYCTQCNQHIKYDQKISDGEVMVCGVECAKQWVEDRKKQHAIIEALAECEEPPLSEEEQKQYDMSEDGLVAEFEEMLKS